MYFYNIGDEFCHELDTMYDMMVEEGLDEKIIHKADRVIGGTSFFCVEYFEVGDRGECSGCPKYKPRNGKSGICSHWRFSYESGDEILIKTKINT